MRLNDTDNHIETTTQTRFLPRVLSEATDIITASNDGSALFGKAGKDVLLGGNGFDALYGQDGNDYLNGGGGNDYLNGNVGDDLLDGGDGFDILYGSNGNDVLNGDGGGDLLFGGDGEDELFGGGGDDTLTGGANADVFVLGRDRGVDILTDFKAGLDRINLIDGLQFADLTIEQGETTIASRIIETATGNVLATLTTTPFNTIVDSNFF
ncbi:MAG: calcium-binding protein [Geitlerinemataceae cyanobacterium]